MHTTTVMRSVDFQYWHVDEHGQKTQGDFATFCPQYHIQDRMGWLCHVLTRPYTRQAMHFSRSPRRFTTCCASARRPFSIIRTISLFAMSMRTVSPRTGNGSSSPWRHLAAHGGALDVWPESSWILASGSASGMLKKCLIGRLIVCSGRRLFYRALAKPLFLTTSARFSAPA